jgi:EAL domain-containing protein (putative c-di-GMP-specific phosphodiesterase class I)
VQLGHKLALRIVAEGVETAEQAELLQALGCDEVQGFWFARPMACNEFEAYLASMITAEAGG